MRVLSVIGLVLTILVIGFVVYFFAFTKAIPVSWVEGKINVEHLAGYDFSSFTAVNNAGDIGAKKISKKYVVDSDGERVLASFDEFEMQKVGNNGENGNNLRMKVVSVEKDISTFEVKQSEEQYFYIVDSIYCKQFVNEVENDISANDWTALVVENFVSALPLNESGKYPYAESLMQNIKKVEQKGFFATIYCVIDNVEIKIDFDFFNQQFKSYTEEVKVFEGDVLAEVIVNEYNILYPTQIVLPLEEV